MRLNEDQQHHGEFLLNVGNGNIPTHPIHGPDFIQLPEEISGTTSLQELISRTYTDDLQNVDLSNRAREPDAPWFHASVIHEFFRRLGFHELLDIDSWRSSSN